MILLSCVAWSFYTVLGKKYGASTDPLTLTAGAAVYGSIFSAISCIGTIDQYPFIYADRMALYSVCQYICISCRLFCLECRCKASRRGKGCSLY
ncbi:hypothetical protein ACSE3M_17670 [Bacillus velezensis]|uniref:hypothetical protein n=1 Tax=Bacillus velezensis TaxID=492670 RepID=UPI003BF82486